MEAYVYMGLWFVCGLLMIFRFGRENAIFYWLGAFFLFLGAWLLADILLPVNLFEGPWPWVLRGISACALAAAIWAYYREKKKTSQADQPAQTAQTDRTAGDSSGKGEALPEKVSGSADSAGSAEAPQGSSESLESPELQPLCEAPGAALEDGEDGECPAERTEESSAAEKKD